MSTAIDFPTDLPATSEKIGAPVEIKIAYIGGGSREWAVKLMTDLALSPNLCGLVSLYDIDQQASERNASLSDCIFSNKQAQTRFQVEAQPDLKAALQGADFVVVSIEPGHIKRRYADLEIPAKYGILQTVGDTTGPGGIMRALRIAPVYEELAHAIVEICPEAWVINYSNPMALCVRLLLQAAPKIKVFGCCHEVFGTQKYLAKMAAQWLSIEEPPRESIQLELAGVNHFTFATSAHYEGYDLLAKLREVMKEEGFFDSQTKFAESAKANKRWFDTRCLIANDLYRRYGALGAAGDRHLVEFLPWYLKDETELHRWGLVASPFSWRLQRWQDAYFNPEDLEKNGLQPSGEEGVQQIEALLGLRSLVTNVNLPNHGQMAGFPEGAVVETYAAFTRNQIHPLVAPELPRGVASLVRRSIDEQNLTLQSAVSRDFNSGLQALAQQPLVSLPIEKVEAMFLEMIDYNQDMLEEYRW